MKLTANNEIKYTLSVPAVADLFTLAAELGYTGKKFRKDLISFVKSKGFNCVYNNGRRMVLSVF